MTQSRRVPGLLWLVALLAAPALAGAPSTDLPLLQTHWGQTGFYARYSPNHERVGCWSVALGQILYYHRLRAQGNIRYQCSNGTDVGCDIARYSADFANFANSLATAPELQRNAVAAYLFITASVLEKDYGTGDYVLEKRSAPRTWHGTTPAGPSTSTPSTPPWRRWNRSSPEKLTPAVPSCSTSGTLLIRNSMPS